MIQNSNSDNKQLTSLSAIGSGVSLVCFFAPWIGCAGESISGADLGGGFWLVFLSSAISLASFFFFRSQRALSKAKKIILTASIFGIGYIMIKYFDFTSNEFHEAFEIKWGGIGTLIGFIIAIFGIKYLKDEEVQMPEKGNTEIMILCSSCGNSYPAGTDKKFCEKCGNKLST